MGRTTVSLSSRLYNYVEKYRPKGWGAQFIGCPMYGRLAHGNDYRIGNMRVVLNTRVSGQRKE